MQKNQPQQIHFNQNLVPLTKNTRCVMNGNPFQILTLNERKNIQIIHNISLMLNYTFVCNLIDQGNTFKLIGDQNMKKYEIGHKSNRTSQSSDFNLTSGQINFSLNSLALAQCQTIRINNNRFIVQARKNLRMFQSQKLIKNYSIPVPQNHTFKNAYHAGMQTHIITNSKQPKAIYIHRVQVLYFSNKDYIKLLHYYDSNQIQASFDGQYLLKEHFINGDLCHLFARFHQNKNLLVYLKQKAVYILYLIDQPQIQIQLQQIQDLDKIHYLQQIGDCILIVVDKIIIKIQENTIIDLQLIILIKISINYGKGAYNQ